VVEDEERVRALLSDTFEAAGHSIVQARDGAEALRRLQEEDFELVISDIGLPEVSGLQVTRWIRLNRPALPVILATGWIEMITPVDYEQGRIDAVFKKPYAVKDVLERACELLNAVRNEKPQRELLHQ
jgi:DNA-binding response OmpR family regulator